MIVICLLSWKANVWIRSLSWFVQKLVACADSSHRIAFKMSERKKVLIYLSIQLEEGRVLNSLCNDLLHIGNLSVLISIISKHWFRFAMCWLMMTFGSMWSAKHQSTKRYWSKKSNKKWYTLQLCALENWNTHAPMRISTWSLA